MAANNNQNFNIGLDAVLQRYTAVEQRDYQKESIKTTIQALNDGADVLINLPTGTGKTLIYAPIAAEASENGLRTLVLTSTKEGQSRVNAEIQKFKNESPAALVF